MRKLILNADDFGMSKQFNKGIIKLVDKGLVRSVSVMISRPHVESKILVNKEISIGVHLELTNNDSEEEIFSQIRSFENRFGKLPSHFDGHQHCHLTKENIMKMVAVASKLDIPVRSRFEKDRNIFKMHKVKTNDAFISWYPKRIERLKEKLKNANGSIEMVCHPGYYDKKSKVSYNERREMELEFLLSDEFQNISRSFQMINWHQI